MKPSDSAGRRPRTLVRDSLVLSGHDIGSRVVSGATFQFMGVALRILITVASMASLARLLSPADFGYIAMATVVTELAGLFGNFGFTNVLIQKRRISRLQIDTVFWASLFLGLLLTAAVFGASFFAGVLFADGRVGQLLRVMSWTFAIGSLSTVPWVVLARLLRFRTEFWLQILTVASRSLVAVLCALAGFGLWSLVVGAMFGLVLNAVLGFIAVPYKPRLRFHWKYLTSTWRTSGSYFGGGLLYYVNTSLDVFLIGRYLGATPLGYYQNARSLTDEIRARLAMPLQHVLFPAFAAIQNDRERFGILVRRSGRTLAAIVFPIGFGVSACAADLVPVLYGSQWSPMIPVMTMFGISTSLRAATAMSSPLFNATDQVALSLRYSVVGTVLMVGGIAAAIPYGVNAVAMTVAVTSLYSLVAFHAAFRLIGLGVRDLWEVLGPPAVASLVMWPAIAASRAWALGHTTSPGMLLLCDVLIGSAVYLVALHLISRQYLLDFHDFFGHLLQRRGQSPS